MASFKFRLEQVCLYRKQLEEQAMQILAKATMQRDATLARIEELHAGIAEQRARLCQADALTAAERWLAQSYETALKSDIIYAYRVLAQQENEVDLLRADLVKKAQEASLLDTLKEKQAARYAQQERQNEQKIYDETATLRYKPATI